MALDWNAIEEEYKSDYKDYAPNGVYKTTLNGVELKQVGQKGNFIVKFQFEETDDYKFPTADHWIVKDKQNWRVKHMKDLMVVLGSSEENAKKACEIAESKDNFDYAIQGYEKAFTALAKKKPEVEIEISQDGKYSRAEFTDRRVAMRNNKKEDVIASGEEIVLDTELPFN